MVGLDLALFSKMVKNHCCRSKKKINSHNILLFSHNDQTGSVVIMLLATSD